MLKPHKHRNNSKCPDYPQRNHRCDINFNNKSLQLREDTGE